MKTKSAIDLSEFAKLTAAMFLAAATLVVATDRSWPAGAGFCEPKSAMMTLAKDHHAKWHKATEAQWQFLRGISVMNPTTPPGLPYGDSAGWLTREDGDDAMVWFIDDDQACTPMPAPKILLDMLDDILTGKISHPGKAL